MSSSPKGGHSRTSTFDTGSLRTPDRVTTTPSPRISIPSRGHSRTNSQSSTTDKPVEAPAPNSKEAREARKKALLAYYQMEAEPSSQKPVERKSVSDMDLDTPNFNTDKYVSKLLAKKNLSELMIENTMLNDQTKNLDTQMQKLVYQNYNKFITATDTIKKMKTQVGGMESDMEALSKSMDEILDTSNTINRNLASKREKIENLSNVNSTLKKLQFILELPDRLTQCLNLQSYTVAVKYYRYASNILEKYRTLPSFQSIELETNEIMGKMKRSLRDQVTGESVPRAKNIENHKLLFLLGESVEELLLSFLAIREKDLMLRLTEFTPKNEATLGENITELNKKFFLRFFDGLKLYKSVFLVQEASGFDTSVIFAQFTDKIFVEYFKIVNVMMGKTPVVFKTNSEKSLEDLRTVMSNFSTEIGVADEQTPKCKIGRMTSDCLLALVNRYMKENFDMYHSHIKAQMDKFLAAKVDKKINEEESIKYAQKLFEEYYEISKQVQSFADQADQYLAVKISEVLRGFQEFTHATLSMIVDLLDKNSQKNSESRICSEDPKITTTPTGALLLCKFATEMSKSTVAKFEQVLIKFDAKSSCKSYVSKFDSLSLKLLIYYIERQAGNLSGIIQVGLENQNWAENEAPRGTKHMIQVLVQEVESIDTEVSKFYPDDDENDRSESQSFTSEVGTSFSYKKSFGTLEENAITKDVLKLFNKNLTRLAVTNPEFRRNSILSEIIKISLKTFDECVRMMTFSKCGYQQIQVDTHYLQMCWRDLIEDENFVRSLLSDIFNIASERCLDPVPLQPNIVSHLCSKK